MKISINEISKLSGFSPATVSNALNNKKGVCRETAEKIIKIAQDNGYFTKPKIAGIKFVIYKNNGLVVSNSPFFASLIAGVVSESKKYGYDTAIFNLDKSSPEFEQNLNQLMTDGKSAILLLATEMTEEEIQVFNNIPAPVVILDGWFEKSVFNSVLINNTDSANSAVQFLIENGHRKIGYLGGNERIRNFIDRKRGFDHALIQNGLKINPSYDFYLMPSMDGAYNDMNLLLEKKPELPTAFFADNDIIALGAMKALKDHGYSIPNDISIIGFDDVEFSSISTPALTTIRVFKQEMGQIAVRRLIELINTDTKVKSKIQICNEFVVRDSVKRL